MQQYPTAASPAERLDRALDQLLGGARPVADPELRRLLSASTAVSAALREVPAGARFAERLRSRLAHPGRVSRVTGAVSDLAHRRPSWLLLTGAVSTAAVGVGVTAVYVWRGSRRAGHR